MPLFVSEDKIDKWFDPKENSWVYRGFKFWFQNPLWNKKIPVGFSLCPYFHMAVISWVIFMPVFYFIIFPLTIACKGFIHITGGSLSKIDKKLFYSLWGTDDKYHIGKGFAISLFLTFLLAVFLFFSGAVLHLIYNAWMVLPSLWFRIQVFGGIVILFSLLFSLPYQCKHRGSKCKPLYYLPFVMAIYMLALGLIDSSLLKEGLTSLILFPGLLYSLLVSLSQPIGSGFSFLFARLELGLSWAVNTSLLGIAPIIWFGLATVVLFVLEIKREKRHKEKLESSLTMDEILDTLVDWTFKAKQDLCGETYVGLNNRVNNRGNSNLLFHVKKKLSSRFEYNYYPYILDGSRSDSINKCKFLSLKKIYKFYFNKYLEESNLEANDFRYKHMLSFKKSFKDWCSLVPSYLFLEERNIFNVEEQYVAALENPFNEIAYTFKNKMPTTWTEEEYEGFLQENSEIKNELDKIFEKESSKLNSKIEAEKLATEKTNHKNNEMFEKYGLRIEALCSPLWNILWYPFKLMWKVLKEIGTFIVYMCILFKAIKNKACPYKLFETPDKTNMVSRDLPRQAGE